MMAPRRSRGLRLITTTAIALFVLLALLSDLWTESPSSNLHFVPSSLDWSLYPDFHPAGKTKKPPSGRSRRIPAVQAPLSSFANPNEPDPRRDDVLHVFRRSYNAYKQHAWLHDELAPISGAGKDTFGGFAATLVDALDTLWIMGEMDDFYEAAGAITALDFANTTEGAVNLFETTIRHLGGLLSAYDLSHERPILKKAIELGEMLYKAFDTPNRLPGFWLNFEEAREGAQTAGRNDPSACPTSLSLEFTRLSQITGDPKFYDATHRVTKFLEKVQQETKLPGMWPVTMNFRDQSATSHWFSLGALADSLYEYLPKMHLLLGGRDSVYEKLYRTAAYQIEEHLLFRPMTPDSEDVLFVGDARVSSDEIRHVPESQHLTCFAGGMFGLGGKIFEMEDHVDIGDRLARGCGWAYGQFPTGVMPEVFYLIPCQSRDDCAWNETRWRKEGDELLNKGWGSVRDSRYILRPEAIESVFILYRMTGKEDLRDLAWDMFKGIIRSTETDLAYSAIEDVTDRGKPTKADSMEVSVHSTQAFRAVDFFYP